jgi:hypothetical protein
MGNAVFNLLLRISYQIKLLPIPYDLNIRQIRLIQVLIPMRGFNFSCIFLYFSYLLIFMFKKCHKMTIL